MQPRGPGGGRPSARSGVVFRWQLEEQTLAELLNLFSNPHESVYQEIGIPHRLVVSDRGLEEGAIEYKHRAKPDSEMIKQAGVVQFLRDLIKY